MTHYNFKLCTQSDESTIIDFLMTVKDELYLPDRAAVESMMALVFDQGDAVCVYCGNQIVGMMGFFYGEPAQSFANKEVVFLYVAAIDPAFRLSRVFYKGLKFALRELENMGKTEIRLQAEAANPYTNKLYVRFASFMYASKSLRGVPVNTYGGSIRHALDRLDMRRRRRASQPMPATAVLA
jgi:hypothetical protein